MACCITIWLTHCIEPADIPCVVQPILLVIWFDLMPIHIPASIAQLGETTRAEPACLNHGHIYCCINAFMNLPSQWTCVLKAAQLLLYATAVVVFTHIYDKGCVLHGKCMAH